MRGLRKYFADEKAKMKLPKRKPLPQSSKSPPNRKCQSLAESEVSKPETSDESVISSTESETSNAPSTETQNPKSGDSGAAAAAVFAVLGGGVLVLLKKKKITAFTERGKEASRNSEKPL